MSIELYRRRGELKAAAMGIRAANPRAPIVHLDRIAPERSGYQRRAGGARCGNAGDRRRAHLTTDLAAVTCYSCVDTIPVDEAEYEAGCSLYTANLVAQSIAAPTPAGARWRAALELARRHPDEYAELVDLERVVGALAGRR